jgi:hypothetical protein
MKALRWLERPERTRVFPRPETVPSLTQPLAGVLPSGIVPYVFGIDNLGAGAAAKRLYRAMPGSAATFAQIGITAVFAGEVVALGLHANAAKTAGTASVEVYVAGVALGAILEWPNEDRAVQVFPRGRHIFAALAQLDVRATTSASYAPTTTDLEVILYLAQTTRD